MEAAQTMFSAGGYEATSLRQIAGAAGVDLATLKYHFGGKSDLFGEVYKEGYDAFMGVMSPFVARASAVSTVVELRAAIDILAADVVSFLTAYEWFARLYLYRLLEDASDITGLEEELEGIARDLIERGLASMVSRGLISPVDIGSMLTFLVSGVPIWMVATRGRWGWGGDPDPLTPQGQERFEAFVREILLRTLNLRDAG